MRTHPPLGVAHEQRYTLGNATFHSAREGGEVTGSSGGILGHTCRITGASLVMPRTSQAVSSSEAENSLSWEAAAGGVAGPTARRRDDDDISKRCVVLLMRYLGIVWGPGFPQRDLIGLVRYLGEKKKGK